MGRLRQQQRRHSQDGRTRCRSSNTGWEPQAVLGGWGAAAAKMVSVGGKFESSWLGSTDGMQRRIAGGCSQNCRGCGTETAAAAPPGRSRGWGSARGAGALRDDAEDQAEAYRVQGLAQLEGRGWAAQVGYVARVLKAFEGERHWEEMSCFLLRRRRRHWPQQRPDWGWSGGRVQLVDFGWAQRGKPWERASSRRNGLILLSTSSGSARLIRAR